MMSFLKQDGLNKNIHLVNIEPEVGGNGQPVAFNPGDDDCHVNVTLRLGIALRVGAVQIDLRLCAEPRSDYALVVSDESDGFVSGENFCIIHCCICFVSSIISRHFSAFSERAMPVLYSGYRA